MKFLASALALAAQGKLDQTSANEQCKNFKFCETFNDKEKFKKDWNIISDGKFGGKWEVKTREKSELTDDDDTALVVMDQAQHHAISADFEGVKGGDLFMQYEVKLQDGLSCGGAYVKMFDGKKEGFNNDTPYIIMFGPDKCGYTNKVHFILRHENPKTKEWIEHHVSNPPKIKDDKNTHVYSLYVSKDNTFEISIDQEVVKKGDLMKDMTPPIIPEAKIKDENDKKPSDWVDNKMMDDPTASKPGDWDEDQPAQIPDPDAKMPECWKTDGPAQIRDPKATKPDDWDDADDGEWEAPLIDNPDCKPPCGCGEFVAPLIKNPNHKGRWKAPQIENPEYKGEWKQKEIDNPAYFESATPGVLPTISAIGYELWTMSKLILFDNIILGEGEKAKADGEKFAKLTSEERRKAEEDAEKEKKEKEEAAAAKKAEDKELDDELNLDKEEQEL